MLLDLSNHFYSKFVHRSKFYITLQFHSSSNTSFIRSLHFPSLRAWCIYKWWLLLALQLLLPKMTFYDESKLTRITFFFIIGFFHRFTGFSLDYRGKNRKLYFPFILHTFEIPFLSKWFPPSIIQVFKLNFSYFFMYVMLFISYQEN